MAWPKGKKREPGTVGRPAGSPNKLSATAKENIAAVFDLMGGSPAMQEWALKNPTEFYKIYARLLPHELGGSVNGAFKLEAPWLESVAKNRGWASTATDPEGHS